MVNIHGQIFILNDIYLPHGMTLYDNLSSGVESYEIGKNHIIVKFKAGGTYKYTYATAGRPAIEKMKKLAISNAGLSTYISRHKPAFSI